jgi:ATP-dependent RNA helicase DeaD
MVFAGTELASDVKRAIDAMGFVKATPVQEKTIPAFLTGGDLIVQAPTGTGKTGAFGIPLAQMLEPREPYAQALILSPTRELAIQTARVLQKLMLFKKGLRVATLYGGESIYRQFDALRRRPQIIVATPGRLLYHILERGGFRQPEHGSQIVVFGRSGPDAGTGFKDVSEIELHPGSDFRLSARTVLFLGDTPEGNFWRSARHYRTTQKHIRDQAEHAGPVKSVQQFYTPR